MNSGKIKDRFNSDDKVVLEVREGWKHYYLFWSIAGFLIVPVCLIIPSFREDTIGFFFRDWNITTLLAIFVVFGMPTISLIFYFDKRVKIKIDALGIWTKKHDTIFWSDISAYRTSQVYLNEGDNYAIILQLNELQKEVRIEFRRMDKDIEEIRAAINYFAMHYHIEDKGHKKGFF